MTNQVALRAEAARRRRAADAAIDAWLSQPRGQRDSWLLVHAQRDLQFADGLERLLSELLPEPSEKGKEPV